MPIEEGYRVTLSYNLFFEEAQKRVLQAEGYPIQVYEGTATKLPFLIFQHIFIVC